MSLVMVLAFVFNFSPALYATGYAAGSFDAVYDLTSFKVDGHTGYADESAKTVTFNVPDEILSTYNGLSGVMSELDADGGTIIFLIGGIEYPRQTGGNVGFNDGHQVYVSAENIYTIKIIPVYGPPAPEIILNYEREWLGNLSTAMEYRIDGGAWVRATRQAMPLQDNPYLYGKTVEVRFATTSTEPASQRAIYVILPVGHGTTPPNVVYDPVTDMITGLDSTMEYRDKDTILWNPCTGDINASELRSFTADRNLEFRYSGIGSSVPPSLSTDITLPIKPVPPLEPIAVDLEREMIINLDPGKTYHFQIGMTAFGVFGNPAEVSISDRINATTPINIRVIEMPSFTEVAILTVPRRPAAPNISFTYNQDLDKYIASSWDNIEIKASTQWIYLPDSNGVVDVPENNATYSLRTRSNSSSPASSIQTVTLHGRGAAPNTPALSYVTETITGLTSEMEYRVGSGGWQDVAGTSFNFANTPSVYGQTVSIRTKSTSTTPASKTNEIDLLEQGVAPDVSLASNGVNVNTTEAMQYRVQGTTTWITCTTNMSVASFISPTETVVLEIRYRGASNITPPSEISLVSLNHRFNVNGLVSFNRTSILTKNNEDFYAFSTNGGNTYLFELDSTNSNYAVMLCTWNKDTGVVYATGIYAFAGTPYAHRLPAGDYAWYVFSDNGTFGQAYTLMVNGSLPYDTSDCITVSPDYMYTYSLISGELYRNMVKFNEPYQFSYNLHITGNHVFNYQIGLYNPNLTSVHKIGSFTYVDGDRNNAVITIPRAIMFNVGEGSLWSQLFFYTVLDYDGVPILRRDVKDQIGRDTPRYLDSYDMSRGPHYLIYDMDTHRWVSFLSELSWEWHPHGDMKRDPVY